VALIEWLMFIEAMACSRPVKLRVAKGFPSVTLESRC